MKHSNTNNHFSEREKQILELLINGKTSEEIAKALCISKNTVDKHRSNMLGKMNVKNTTELIVKCFTLGFSENGNSSAENNANRE